VLQVGNHYDDTVFYVAFGFNLKADLTSGAIVVNPIGPVWFIVQSENYLSLTIWFEQVDGCQIDISLQAIQSDIHYADRPFIAADRPLQEHPGFTVSAPKVEARNKNITAALGSSALFQAIKRLSPQQRKAAKALHVQELADILFENRMQVPKKPVLVSHLRLHQWYTDLFQLTSPLQNDKAHLVLNLFKQKLAELEN